MNIDEIIQEYSKNENTFYILKAELVLWYEGRREWKKLSYPAQRIVLRWESLEKMEQDWNYKFAHN